MKRRVSVATVLLLLTGFAFVLQGYHPGAEDDAVYLSAIKKHLSPGLYPYNAEFFTVQTQATVFDKVVAAAVRVSHLPVSYVELLFQLTSIAVLLAGCWAILAHCFASFRARLAGVMMVSCLLTLSVAGTALYISDEHLHPRIVATDAILFSILAVQQGKAARAALLLVAAFLFHPIMAVFGISFCLLYAVVQRATTNRAAETQAWAPRGLVLRAAAIPGSWLLAPANAAWRQAMLQHSYYTLRQWAWYEWLGALAPPLILGWFAWLGRRQGNHALYCLSVTATFFSTLQLCAACAMLLPLRLQRLSPLQPMRYLHLTFLLMALIGGGLLGEYVLRTRVARWLLVFVPLAAVNGYAQRTRYPATPNLELPWQTPQSPWLQAFQWVKKNTPEDAVFALDPYYLALPGEDNHSFRALAERSSLVDDSKDAAVVTQVPQLANRWLAQHKEQAGWRGWSRSDFARLAVETPASWALVNPAQSAGLSCPFANHAVSVCRLP